jgi:hypothetical protein
MGRVLLGSHGLLRSFSWKGLGAFLLFAAALAAWTWSGVFLYPKTLTFTQHAEYFLSLFQRNLVTYFPVYLVVALADGLPLRGARRNAVLVGALVAGVLLAVQVRCAAMPSQLLYVYGSIQMPYCTAFPTWRTYFDFPNTFISPLTIAGAVMIFVFSRRRDAELVAALHAARTTQVEARRQRIESEIEAMRSRIDPDGLLETLRAIRSRYEADPRGGESSLDELIRRLREAAGRAGPEPAGAGE